MMPAAKIRRLRPIAALRNHWEQFRARPEAYLLQFDAALRASIINAASQAPLAPPNTEKRLGEWFGARACKPSSTKAVTVRTPATTNGRRQPRQIMAEAMK